MTDDLIQRLESATGPSRELDADILCAVDPIWYRSPAAVAPWCHDGNGGARRALPYTSSIDAALTLVPEGFPWGAGDDRRGNSFADVHTVAGEHVGTMIHVKGATPAIALCIAALKARTAEKE